MSVQQARTEARYWAFLSYSRADLRTARSLQRRLERFAVPPALQRPPREPGQRRTRLSPVFRDEADLATSGMLDERLRAAIDDSAAMVLLASPDSARSRYVDLEVEHFIRTRGVERLAIVAIGEGGQRHPPLPAALRELGEGPLWIDCRDQRQVGRRALVRIAAAVLGVDFDLLWGGTGPAASGSWPGGWRSRRWSPRSSAVRSGSRSSPSSAGRNGRSPTSASGSPRSTTSRWTTRPSSSPAPTTSTATA